MSLLPLRTVLVMTFLLAAAAFACLSPASAQTVSTSTITQLTSVSVTSTLLSTITGQVVVYTTTTQTMGSTVQATETLVQPSTTTITSTYTAAVSGTTTETVSVTLTQVSTETTQILGNIWGEALAAILLLTAALSFLIPKRHPSPPKGFVCRNCGTPNPPYARAYCVKCGHRLGER